MVRCALHYAHRLRASTAGSASLAAIVVLVFEWVFALAQERVDVGLELYLDVVFVDVDALDDKLQVLLFEVGFGEDVVKDLHRGFGGAVGADYGVALVCDVLELVLQSLYAAHEVGLQLIVRLFEHGLVFWVAHDVAHALPLRGLQFLLRVEQHVL